MGNIENLTNMGKGRKKGSKNKATIYKEQIEELTRQLERFERSNNKGNNNGSHKGLFEGLLKELDNPLLKGVGSFASVPILKGLGITGAIALQWIAEENLKIPVKRTISKEESHYETVTEPNPKAITDPRLKKWMLEQGQEIPPDTIQVRKKVVTKGSEKVTDFIPYPPILHTIVKLLQTIVVFIQGSEWFGDGIEGIKNIADKLDIDTEELVLLLVAPPIGIGKIVSDII